MAGRIHITGFKKILASVIVLILFMSVEIIGCSSIDKESSDNTANTGWYDNERILFNDIEGGLGYGHGTYDGLVYTDGDIFLMNYSTFDQDTETNYLQMYDSEANLMLDIDADKAITEPKNVSGQFSYDFFVRGGEVCCLGRMLDWSKNSDRFYLCIFDEEAGTFGEWNEITDIGKQITISYMPIRIFAADDKIDIYFNLSSFDGMGNLIKVTVDNDNNVSSLDFSEVLNDRSYYGIDNVYRCNANEVILSCYSENSSDVLIVNEDTMESRLSTGITDSADIMQCGDMICRSDNYAIEAYDPDTDSFYELVSYDNSNINRYEAGALRPVYFNDGEIVLFGLFGQNSDGHMSHEAVKLIPSDNDLRVGKTELKLAVLGSHNWLNYEYAEAICTFNASNPNAFIVLDKRYLSDLPTSFDYDYWLSTERIVDQMDEESELSNRIMVDLISGNGPDIILNGYSYTMLNNSRCLVDLTDYIDGPDGIDRERFFNNIFEGNTYQIPLSALLYGVIYRSEQTGFELTAPTYEEYRQFISEGCNGADPIGVESNKLKYFLILFENIYPEISDDNGIPRLDNDEFRALAEYCKDLPEIATQEYSDVAVFNEYALSWGELAHMGDRIMGLPSNSGIGYRLRICDSVGISADCPDVDSAWEFVRILLSDDIQGLTTLATNSVIRDVSRNAIADSIDRNNIDADNYKPIDEWDSGPERIDEGVAELYINAMDTALPTSNLDPDVKVVLYEEIQAYFAGAKTLDEIIPIIEDRCETIINERG